MPELPLGIGKGAAPGGLVFVSTTHDGVPILRRAVSGDEVEDCQGFAEADGEEARRIAGPEATILLAVYDGDSGLLVHLEMIEP